jgi:catechol 2,3-dioxygenase-like lactoylglutathione lyase family enzyme
MRLNHVTLACRDLERSVRFYRTLGLVPIVLSAHYARLACPEGQATLSLDLDPAALAASSVIYFECAELDATVAALTAQGLAFTTAPRDESWLWREARLCDPDGNPLCLYWAGSNRLDPPWRVPSVLA